MLKIGLDIDDVLSNFYEEYVKKFGVPKSDIEVTYNVENILKYDKDFWINLKCTKPNFKPWLYCTKRVNSKEWTFQYLSKHNLLFDKDRRIPVYQMYYQWGKKSSLIKGKVDVFVDDSIRNFIEINLSGVPCLLYNTPGNMDWGNVGRVYSLDREEIENTYELFKNTVGNNFRKLL